MPILANIWRIYSSLGIELKGISKAIFFWYDNATQNHSQVIKLCYYHTIIASAFNNNMDRIDGRFIAEYFVVPFEPEESIRSFIRNRRANNNRITHFIDYFLSNNNPKVQSIFL